LGNIYKFLTLNSRLMASASLLSEANRRFIIELANMLNKEVQVITTNGIKYRGSLVGIDSSLNIIIANAVTDKNEKYPRVVIMNHTVAQMILLEEHLDLRDFAKYLEKYFPGMVRYVEEANIVLVGDKVRVTETGVEGVGPIAKRVKEIYDEYLTKRR